MHKKNKFKKLYLEEFLIKNKAKLIPYANYMMPINYSEGIIKEHLHTRKSEIKITKNLKWIWRIENF